MQFSLNFYKVPSQLAKLLILISIYFYFEALKKILKHSDQMINVLFTGLLLIKVPVTKCEDDTNIASGKYFVFRWKIILFLNYLKICFFRMENINVGFLNSEKTMYANLNIKHYRVRFESRKYASAFVNILILYFSRKIHPMALKWCNFAKKKRKKFFFFCFTKE